MKRYGLLPEVRRPTDWQFGGLSGVENAEVLRADGQWDAFLPALEKQRNPNFDTMSCVTFSALNAVETLIFRKYDEVINFSDRFTACLSGTGPDGNNFWNVAESIRKDGLVEEERWPFFTHLQTQQDYLTRPPQEIVDASKRIYERYRFSYEYVWDTPESLMEALKYAPVQVGFHAYCPESDGIFLRCAARGNHAVLLYGYVAGQYWKIFDHYDRSFKKLAWDTVFYGALKYNVEKVIPNAPAPMPFKDKVLYQLVDPKSRGGFLVMAGGKLRLDETSKIVATWITLNSKDGAFTGGPTGLITSMKELEGVQLYNLKNEPISL